MSELSELRKQAVDRGRRYLLEQRPGGVSNLVFATISGAHLYGFPSPDSDLDVRGAFLAKLDDVIGISPCKETEELKNGSIDGVEADCVAHELGKYLRLLVNKNGYVLEQIFSPLVVHDGGHLQELRVLARGAVTRHVVHHYRGFFATQEKLVLKNPAPTAKAVLYLFRVAMTGIHLLRTGEVEADLSELNLHYFKLPFIPDLVERKRVGAEKGLLGQDEFAAFHAEARLLEAELSEAFETSALPDQVMNYGEVNDFLVRLRLSVAGRVS